MDRCFACGKKLGKNPILVDTRDDQTVFVGRECAKLVMAAGDAGYQPPGWIGRDGREHFGPRLYPLKEGDE